MNTHRRMTAGLVFVLGLMLGFGIWQQHTQAAGQTRQWLQRYVSSGTVNKLASSSLHPASAAPMATITVQSLGDGA